MRRYEDAPGWWFHALLALSAAVSLVLCTVLRKEVQLPWWGLLFACAMALAFTLPVSVITATTNQTPGLNVLSEYVIGLILPGKPIANVCFKVYGYMSMSQAVSFLADFKLGHYMKIPPKSTFLVQLVGTVVAGTVNLGVAYWLLGSVPNICQDALLPADSPWTCPSDRVFFDASVIWGLVGPRRIFGPLGNYGALNWFFLAGAAGPAAVYALHRAFPARRWIRMVNLPVLIGATASMPPATAVNYNSWLLIGVAFNFFVFRYRKRWWERYNYILPSWGCCSTSRCRWRTGTSAGGGRAGSTARSRRAPRREGWISALTAFALSSCNQRSFTALLPLFQKNNNVNFISEGVKQFQL